MAISQLIGAPVKRREDPELITGTGHYVDDLPAVGVLHMYVVRGQHAHARILGVDTARALEADGVVAVLTGRDIVPALKAPLPVTVWFVPDKKSPGQFPIATDKVRYLGEPVAVVLATSRAAAEDAAERLEVRSEPLPAITEIDPAMRKEAPLVHEELGTNISYDSKFGSGDIEAAFREADIKIKQRIVQQRLFPVAIEPRGVVADYSPFGKTLTVWSSTQVPHFLKVFLAVILGLPEQNVRVVAPDVGGGFGSKIRVYSEEVLAAAASIKLGRPVKWIGDRSEDLKATTHGRDQIFDLEVAAKRDGTLLGLRATQYLNLGAYVGMFGSFQTVAMLIIEGVYRWKAFAGRSVGVFTNTTPTDPYRGAGRPEATHAVERAIDLVAREIGMDPAEVRRKNFIPKDAFPYNNRAGLTYDSGDYQRAFDKALQLAGYTELRRQQEQLRKQGKYLGIGLSTYVEVCGGGPAAATAPNAGVGLWGSAVVLLHFTGKAEVIVGSSPHGQGHETPFAQVVADVLGIPLEDVEVFHGDTARGPMGMDTYGSRSLSVDGVAAYLSAKKVQEKARRLAAHLLEASEEDLVYEGGRAYVKGAPSKAKTIQELTFAAYQANNLPPGMEPSLEATTFYDPSNFVFPFGAHVCVVEVDAETGAPRIVRYVAVDDCGTRINPLVVEGQIHGGVAQGIAQALLEEVVYRDDGELETGNLVSYLIPTASDLPSFETAETNTPSPVNPLGVKGIGEAGTIAASAAVINAVADALEPFGVKDVDMPASPQKLWRLMQANGGRKGR
jgi:carbon-monoxide dehydrogenase large subunit